MIIWLASYPRSGNTFARVALHYLFGISSRTIYPRADDEKTIEPVIGELPSEMTLAEMAATSELCFAKTHEMPAEDGWPALYLVRDGRDTLVSYAHYILHEEHGVAPGSNRELFLQTLQDLITGEARFGGWAANVLAWKQRRTLTSFLRFEDLIAEPDKELRRWLTAGGDIPLFDAHGPLPSFDKMHETVPWFFRKGRVGAWREEMPSYLQSLFWERHGDAMEAFGYVDREQKRTASPSRETPAGLASYFSPDYQRRTRALLTHLESLGLPLCERRVLELGSGPGDYTGFYLERGCAVISVDSNQAVLNVLLQRFPAAEVRRCDLNSPDSLLDLGSFDIIHCYGTLDHLEQPSALISYIGKACTGIALIGSGVPAFFEELSRLFPFVYQSRLEAVFVASRQGLDLVEKQDQLKIEDGAPRVAAGGCGEWISAIASVWAEVESRDKDLARAVAMITQQLRRAGDLEATAAARLAEMQDRDRVIAQLETVASERLAALLTTDSALGAKTARFEQALREATERADALEKTASERLAALVIADTALTETRADFERALSEATERADLFEAAALERLTALHAADTALTEGRVHLQGASDRADSLEAAAAERLTALEAADAALQEMRGHLQQASERADSLEATAAERLTALHTADAALQEMRGHLQQALERADSLEATAAERLNALLATDAGLIEMRKQLQQAGDRADSLEATAADRLTALIAADRALDETRSELQEASKRADSLETLASERFAELRASEGALDEARIELRRSRSELKQQIYRFEHERLREYLSRRLRRR